MENNLNCNNQETITNEIPITIEEYNNLSNLQQEILAFVVDYKETQIILDKICLLAETLLPNSVASIMLLDKRTGLLSIKAGPSIPPEGHRSLENLTPGPFGGSCGNAVYKKEPQFVQNTYKDDRWKDLRQVAYDFSICTCWSMPIRNQNNETLGSFALSSFEHRGPSSFHKMILQVASSLISIVIRNQKNKNELEFLAYHDKLTKLYNKSFYEKISDKKKEKSLILLNIDNFSYINTAYGFYTGDDLLVKIASILKTIFPKELIFKFNADEFAILFEKEINLEEKILKIQKYFLSNSIKIDNLKLNISFSYGAVYGKENLLRNSSSALKLAKENGKNRFYIFDEKEDSFNYENKEAIVQASNLVRDAIENDKIVPFFQGIYNNKTKIINKYEALVRIKNKEKVISPFYFLEAAKLSGLLPDITKIMIDKTLKKIQNIEDLEISINITEDDLSQNYLTEYFRNKLIEYNVKADRIILEILEGVSSSGKKNHIKQLNSLKALGLRIAIDDFGTEYSNFERLLDLDVDFIKIDAKYIKDIHTNKKSYEITKALAFFAKNVNITCIAEFVHNKEVQKIVNELDIDFSQGYYFSEPKEDLK